MRGWTSQEEVMMGEIRTEMDGGLCTTMYTYIHPRRLIHDKVADAHSPPHAHGGRRDAHAVALEYQHARSMQATSASAHHDRVRAVLATHARGYDHVYIHACIAT